MEMLPSPVFDNNGLLNGFVGITRDISARKRVENELIESEKKKNEFSNDLKMAQSIAHIGNWKWGIKTGLVEWSDEMYRIFGIDKGSYTGRLGDAITKVIHPDDLHVVLPSNASEFAKNKPQEYRIIRPDDGSIHHIWAKAGEAIMDAQGNPEFLTGIAQDITELKQIELALRASEERHRTISSLMSDYVYVSAVTPDGAATTEWVSGAFEQITGYTLEDIQSLPGGFSSLVFAEDLPAIIDQQPRLMKGEAIEVEYRITCRNGETRWLRDFLRPDPTSITGKGLRQLGAVKDITQSKLVEANLKASNERFNMLFHNLPLQAVVYRLIRDRHGEIVDWEVSDINPLGAASLGQKPADLIGKSAIELYGAEVMANYLQLSREVAANGQTQQFETHFKTNNRDYFSSVFMVGKDYYVNVGMDVTERNRAATALRQSETRYHSLFENSPLAIWDEDFSAVKAEFVRLKQAGVSDLRAYWRENPAEFNLLAGMVQINEINNASIRMLGVENKEQIATHLPRYFSDESMLVFKEELLALAEGNTQFQCEIPLISLADERVIFSLALNVQPGFEDSLARVLVTFQDITEIKRVEEALRASEERYRGLLESLDSAIYTVDPDGRFLYLNDVAARQMNANATDITGITLHEILPRHVADLQMDDILAVIQADENKVFEFLNNIQDQPRWSRISIQPKHDENGRVAYALVNSTDIDDLKTAQQELKELNRTLELRVEQRTAEVQDLYDNAPTGYHSLDTDGRVVMMNNTELNWLGYTREEVMGMQLNEFLTEKSKQNFEEEFPAFKQRGWLKDMELEFLRKDGSAFPILINAVANYDERSNFIMSRATVFDNTERKAANEALHRAFRELEHALRMKDEFLANMSHELRTPLNGILGLCEILTLGYRGALNDFQQKYVQSIESSGRHLLSLINDLLDLSKIEAGKFEIHPEIGSIIDLCNSCLSFVKSQAVKKNINIEFIPDPGVPKIMADQRRLKQILVNLLSNAVKFTPSGGKVVLKVAGDLENNKLNFSVSDNGIGIAASDLKRLFTPFTQVDSSLSRQAEGSGLGLAMVKNLAELHGGTVSVSSEIGKGSCFTVSLPWLAVEMPTTAPIQPTGQTKPLSSQVIAAPLEARGTVIMAEDNMVSQTVVSEFLEHMGFRVVKAQTGKEVINLSQTILPVLVLMDIQMPEMDGLEAMRLLRADSRFEIVPIIALTALAMPGDRERCLAAGANDYVSKPVSLKNLADLIDKLVK